MWLLLLLLLSPSIIIYLTAEHMLFYASEKYPLEDSYSKYITQVIPALPFIGGYLFSSLLFL